VRTRVPLAASSLAGLVLAALWLFAFLVSLPARLGGQNVLRWAIVLPDLVLGWTPAPQGWLRASLMLYAPALLLSALAIGLWVASTRHRTARFASCRRA
jgi:hypothetical protein